MWKDVKLSQPAAHDLAGAPRREHVERVRSRAGSGRRAGVDRGGTGPGRDRGGRACCSLPIRTLVTSDLARAQETAAIIGKRLGLTWVQDAALRERNFGTVQGSPLGELAPRVVRHPRRPRRRRRGPSARRGVAPGPEPARRALLPPPGARWSMTATCSSSPTVGSSGSHWRSATGCPSRGWPGATHPTAASGRSVSTRSVHLSCCRAPEHCEERSMRPTALELPARASKPRATGLTMMVDGGLPTRSFQDIVESGAEYLDFVKFGWGTAIVTNDLRQQDRRPRQRRCRLLLRRHAVREVRVAGPLRRLPGALPELWLRLRRGLQRHHQPVEHGEGRLHHEAGRRLPASCPRWGSRMPSARSSWRPTGGSRTSTTTSTPGRSW